MELTDKQIRKVLVLWRNKKPRDFQYWMNTYLPDFNGDSRLALNSYINSGNYIRISEYTPKTKDKHIGLELECFTDYNYESIFKLLVRNDLHVQTTVGYDGSIEKDKIHQTAYEFKFLFKEKELVKFIKKLDKFIKQADLRVNDTCGLHVHLDMRNRNFKNSYKKLVKFQNQLYMLGNEDRINNEYCRPVHSDNSHDKYTAINKEVYDDLSTLEVRLHHGTTDTNKIQNWIRLLTRIVNSANPRSEKVFTSKSGLMKWAKLKSLQDYVKKTYSGTKPYNTHVLTDQELNDCFNNERYNDDW